MRVQSQSRGIDRRRKATLTWWCSPGIRATRIADVRNVQIVFKQGVGYDPAKLIESVRGKVGLF